MLSIFALILDLGVYGAHSGLLARTLSNAQLLLQGAVLATYQYLSLRGRGSRLQAQINARSSGAVCRWLGIWSGFQGFMASEKTDPGGESSPVSRRARRLVYHPKHPTRNSLALIFKRSPCDTQQAFTM